MTPPAAAAVLALLKIVVIMKLEREGDYSELKSYELKSKTRFIKIIFNLFEGKSSHLAQVCTQSVSFARLISPSSCFLDAHLHIA